MSDARPSPAARPLPGAAAAQPRRRRAAALLARRRRCRSSRRSRAIGDRVGSFARAAADKAAARAAERRAAHASHDDDLRRRGDRPHRALDEAPETEIEPPLPVFGRDVPERPSGAQSRIALAIVGVLVLVALFIGINNVAKIGQGDGDPSANAVVTVTATRSASSTPPETTSEPAPTSTTSTPPPTPVSITGGKGYDEQDGTEADQNVKIVFDGDPSTGWRSRWYGTPPTTGARTASASSSS